MAQSTDLQERTEDIGSSIHGGHRQRLKTQFREHGLDTLADVNVLELVLYYAIPRQDTNPIAHRLLDAFGSLDRVFDASIEELMKDGGLSENAALLLKLIPEVSRRQQISKTSFSGLLDSTEKCGAYLAPFFYGQNEECIYLLGLDGKCKPLGCAKLFTGTVNYANLSVRRVVETALKFNASSVILAHNHTSGIAVPSKEDVDTTALVSQALDLVGIPLADHLVFAGNDFVSMAESRMLPEK